MKKILILASNPRKDLNLDTEIRDLKKVIESSRQREDFTVVDELAVRVGDLQELMLKHRPQIVHFCGHGGGEQGLVFESDIGREHLLRTEALANLFRLCSSYTECVLLNACYSEEQANAIVTHIDYVIGMNQEIRDDAAIAFAKGFYRALGYACSIEEAYEFGSNAIQLEISGSSVVSEVQRKLEVIDAVTNTSIPEHLKPILKKKPNISSPDLRLTQETRDEIQLDSDKTLREDTNAKQYRDQVINPILGQTFRSNDENYLLIREHCRQKILSQHSRMRLLGGKEIGVDQLYVDVWLLDRPEHKLYKSPERILEHFDEKNDRYALAKRIGDRKPSFEVANNNKKMVILGKPGSGKTTLLKHLGMDWCKGKFQPDLIAVVIEFRRIQDTKWDLLTAIDKELGLDQIQTINEQINNKQSQIERIDEQFNEQSKRHKDLSELKELEKKTQIAALKQEITALKQELESLPLLVLLRQGKLLLLMDGLDEISTDNLRREVQNQLQEITENYSGNRFILTCRTQIMTSIPLEFTSVEVADFNPEQVQKFVQNWFKVHANDNSDTEANQQWENFRDTVSNNPALEELTIAPVLLSLMCLVQQDHYGNLPSDRAWLYEKGIKLLLNRWNETKVIPVWELGSKAYQELSVEKKEALLTEIAARKFENPKNFVLFEQDEIVAQISQFLQLANSSEGLAVLRAIESQHGLLIERSDELWSFSHLTFQEHFTVQWLTKLPSEQLAAKIANPQWQQVVEQIIKSQQPADRLLKLIKQSVDRSMSDEPTLKQFLTQVFQKAESTQAKYKPEAVRAFYCTLELELEFKDNLVLDLDSELAKDFKRSGTCTSALGPELSLDLDFTHVFAQARKFASNFTIKGADARTRTLYKLLDPALIPTCDLVLASEMKKLRTKLPLEKKSPHFLQWLRTNSQSWLEKLRQVIIEHRNIGYNWHSNEQQKQQLHRYYDTNQFLVKMMQIEGAVTNDVRAEIEQRLLLPLEELQRLYPDVYGQPPITPVDRSL
jgi:predicted NACHT family NTPase